MRRSMKLAMAGCNATERALCTRDFADIKHIVPQHCGSSLATAAAAGGFNPVDLSLRAVHGTAGEPALPCGIPNGWKPLLAGWKLRDAVSLGIPSFCVSAADAKPVSACPRAH